jgi:hypothetical protein
VNDGIQVRNHFGKPRKGDTAVLNLQQYEGTDSHSGLAQLIFFQSAQSPGLPLLARCAVKPLHNIYNLWQSIKIQKCHESVGNRSPRPATALLRRANSNSKSRALPTITRLIPRPETAAAEQPVDRSLQPTNQLRAIAKRVQIPPVTPGDEKKDLRNS